MTTRMFPVELLKEWDLPYGDCVLLVEHVEKHRWYEIQQVVFRAPDDELTYAVFLQRGLTEHQDDHDRFGYETELEGQRVELREVTVMQWLPVE